MREALVGALVALSGIPAGFALALIITGIQDFLERRRAPKD